MTATVLLLCCESQLEILEAASSQLDGVHVSW